MRAVVLDPSDGSLGVRELPDPVAGPGQLLVRVRAAGLNRADLGVRAGTYVGPTGRPTAPFVAGLELAGEVLAVGDGVAGWEVGDRVMSNGAGFAELAVVDAGMAMPAPGPLTWEEAGGLPVAISTMYDSLVVAGRLAPGGAVAIHGVTAGVGVVGAQLALHLGASVVLGTSRSEAKRALVAELVDDDRFRAIDPSQLVELGRSLTDGVGIDVSVDNVGAVALGPAIEVAANAGRIIQVGRVSGSVTEIDLNELARKRLSLIGVSNRTRTPAERLALIAGTRDVLGAALAAGAVRGVVHRTYGLDQVDQAQSALARDEHIGKLVIVP